MELVFWRIGHRAKARGVLHASERPTMALRQAIASDAICFLLTSRHFSGARPNAKEAAPRRP